MNYGRIHVLQRVYTVRLIPGCIRYLASDVAVIESCSTKIIKSFRKTSMTCRKDSAIFTVSSEVGSNSPLYYGVRLHRKLKFLLKNSKYHSCFCKVFQKLERLRAHYVWVPLEVHWLNLTHATSRVPNKSVLLDCMWTLPEAVGTA